MSPREKHVPDDARRTTVALTAEERAAIRWLSELRKAQGSRRHTTNDILVDALWHYLEEKGETTREQIRLTIPVVQKTSDPSNKVAQMPKPKR